MKKTPDEIMEGLRWCTTTDCSDDCPYKRDDDGTDYCGYRLQTDALELIEHQRALIGDLKAELKHLYDALRV